MTAIGRLFSRLSYPGQVFLMAAVPLVLAVTAISMLVTMQARELATREIAELERQLISAKQAELKNYLSIARSAFGAIYGNASPDDEAAKLEVTQLLSAMLYGNDGYFFVFDYDGTNLVSPRRTELITRDWSGMTDSEGTPITETLIELAKKGGGYHSFLWPKPSTGEEAQMVSYVIGLQDWKWAIGTGIFIDDVVATVAAARAAVETRIMRTFLWIGVITLAALLLVFFSGLALNLRERWVANEKQKRLTQRILDAQEEERSRVARELHDSISQILVGVRYALELARRRLAMGDGRAGENLDRGVDSLNHAIQEVRRISRDLRPGVLDDLGLGPALQALTEEFGKRTGIETHFETVVFRNRLDQDAKIALYRIAQEALTNVERHAGASKVSLEVYGHRKGATIRIADDGAGIPHGARTSPGIGLRNMQERMDQLGGVLRILSSPGGTVIEAQVPLTHMLPPEDDTRRTA